MSSEDLIETLVGRCGRYQAFILLLLIVARMPTEFQLVNVVFILPSPEYVCTDAGANNATNFCPCDNPVYKTDIVMSSVSSQFDLICGKRHLASLGQSMLHVGILVGSILYGYISDRFGRKISCILSYITEIVFIAISAAVTEFWMFAVCRFLMGVSMGGTMLCTYVMLIEICGKSFRPFIPGLSQMKYVICYTTLPIISYFITDWKYLQLYTSLPWSFVLLYFFVIPESPRWLLTMGRKKEATEILIYMAKKQNMPTENIEAVVEKTYTELVQDTNKQYGTYRDLIKTPNVRRYTLIVILIWMCCAHTYFGVNQYIGRLQGNIYLNVLLSALCLIPSLIYVVLASLYFNRKISMILTSSIAGTSLLLFIVIPKAMGGLTLAFAIIGLVSAHAAFTQIYLQTAEIFPTVVRNSAMGLASVFARLGSFIAPFVVNIGTEWITIVIFSIVAFGAAFLSIFLPETRNKELLNTISQTEKRDVQRKG